MSTTAVTKPTPIWEDFVDIFVSPAEVFARREKANWLIPAIVVVVAVTVLFIGTRSLLQPAMDAEFHRQMARTLARNPQLTPEQMEKGRAFGEKIALIAPPVVTFIAIVLTGIALWLVGKLVDAKADLSAVLVVASYAAFPKIIGVIAGAVSAALSSPDALVSIYSVTLSAARFLDPDKTSAVVMGLAARVDLFIFWETVLLGIGLSVVGRIKRGPAFIAAIIVWLLGALPTALGALAQPR